jgi:hypothetical protein
MATTLKKFTEAYASMTVASYEPLIVNWVSGWSICAMSSVMAQRMQKAKSYSELKNYPTAQALVLGQKKGPVLPPNPPYSGKEYTPNDNPPLDVFGQPFKASDIQPVKMENFPNAVMVSGRVYPNGILNVNVEEKPGTSGNWFQRIFTSSASEKKANPVVGAKSVVATTNRSLAKIDPDFNLTKARKQVFAKLMGAVQDADPTSGNSLWVNLESALGDIAGHSIYEFLPKENIREALSPIGIVHFYRQLYFNYDEGVGPLEKAFTVAPSETLEVVYENVRRQIHEEIVEIGSEQSLESEIEQKNSEEISDKVSSMIQRDLSASMSANTSGSVGVWSIGASASTNMASSTQRGQETTSRRLKEITSRASERITKTYSLRTRAVEDTTTTDFNRRVIKNETTTPVNYGLRRVFNRIKVKVQDLGSRLVWQLYVENPGVGLAQSKFVLFSEADQIAPPEIPPGVRPRPKGGTDTGSTSSSLKIDTQGRYYITVVAQSGPDREITGISIDSLSDLDGGGKDDTAPSPVNDGQWDCHWDPNTHQYTTNVYINPGDSTSISVQYSFTWEPSQEILDEWEMERKNAVNEITEELLSEQFERKKALITEKSRIPKRPANDLRTEERYEVMNRLISSLFAMGDDLSAPAPIEIEYFHRYFDIDAIFTYTHPAWWKPRFSAASSGMPRPEYEITAESDPAPLGSSLGWKIQLDGDRRRNEFINSPWVRVCLPIKPGLEREAINWLSRHIEGEIGFNLNTGPLKDLVEDVEDFRTKEEALGRVGPNYVEVDSSVGAPEGPAIPEAVYPVIDEFEVTIPTEGFVYDELAIDMS